MKTPLFTQARNLFLLASLGLFSSGLLALPEDRNLPIKVTAARMEWDNQSQQGVYQGGVEASQGELLLTAERVTLYRSEDGSLSQAIAETPDGRAYMRDLPDPNKPQVEAWARQVDYHPGEEKVVLTGQARLQQGEDIFQGHRLTYYLTTQDLVAEQAESESENPPRVEVILTPKTNAEEE
ncbi:lipopolysaccharide transport periplasmic protein LptA [Marinospirillum perlucidum]|uniref:lipopolysaccharide transport periplasmic protein LptA n=1 Tax=Marinospirillum perlucidum TaxID=1982602 RepID=UPI000DF40AD7|nr:lipopolysaccharide transport periplasmic protein LptA [Marinospirillum perlucidum]